MKNIDKTIKKCSQALQELSNIKARMRKIEECKWLIEQTPLQLEKEDNLHNIEMFEQHNKESEELFINLLQQLIEPVINQ